MASFVALEYCSPRNFDYSCAQINLVQIHVKLLLIEPRGLLNVPEDRAVNVAACACSMSGQESKRDQKGTSESAKSGKSGTSSGASSPHNSF
jgi:hypothetical protein